MTVTGRASCVVTWTDSEHMQKNSQVKSHGSKALCNDLCFFFFSQCSHDNELWEQWIHPCELQRDLTAMWGISAMPFLLDIKAQQSHAEAYLSLSGQLIKETSVTGFVDCYFSRGQLYIMQSCNLSPMCNTDIKKKKLTTSSHFLTSGNPNCFCQKALPI